MILDDLRRLADLKDNWDGDNAKGISLITYLAAFHFLKDLNQEAMSLVTKVAPSPEGEILVYWRLDDIYVELNFDIYGKYDLQAT